MRKLFHPGGHRIEYVAKNLKEIGKLGHFFNCMYTYCWDNKKITACKSGLIGAIHLQIDLCGRQEEDGKCIGFPSLVFTHEIGWHFHSCYNVHNGWFFFAFWHHLYFIFPNHLWTAT